MIAGSPRPWQRPLLLFVGVGTLALSWYGLAPERWLGSVIPLGTAGTAYNLDLLHEGRVFLALLGLGAVLAALGTAPLLRAAGLLLEPASRMDGWLQGRRRWQILLLVFTLAVAAILAAYSITRHNHFNSKAYDLGLHAQVFWNSSQGRLFASSVEVDNYLGDHVSPIILLLLPVYWLWPDPRSLLVVQAVALAGGALPVAWLARRRLAEPWPDGAHVASLVLALAYLVYPTLGFVNRFEFHEEVLVVPLLLLSFWLVDTRRPVAMSVLLLLALFCKEDIGLTVAAFGAYVAWRTPGWRAVGLLWVVVGLGWSLFALLIVIPEFRGLQSDTLGRYAWLGSDTREILASLLSQPRLVLRHLAGEPRRLWFLVKFMLPLGFLPLLSPATLLVALPALSYNWLAGNLYQASPYFHYALPLIPPLFAAAIFSLERVARRTLAAASPQRSTSALRALVLVWLVASLGLALTFDHFWQREVGPQDWEVYGLERHVDPASFQAAATLLPADGAVATTEAYAPHLANREGLYLLFDPRILGTSDRIDWVLVDLQDHRYGVEPRLYYGLLRWIADQRRLSVCHFADDVVLLGPTCKAAEMDLAYRSRLFDLQRSVAHLSVQPALAKRLGERYFSAETP